MKLHMRRLRLPGIILLIIIMAASCHPVPVSSSYPSEQIPVGPGPEDMVLDTLQGEARLLISCSARRETQEPYGEIMAYSPESGMTKIMPRVEEPPGIRFRPHGIYLDSSTLYVISHEREPDDHPVLIYNVTGDTLRFIEAVRTPLQHSPNALVTGRDGAIYLVNDSGKRGNMLEKALKLKRASVVKISRDGEGNWTAVRVANGLGYPAGINRMGDTLYVGDAILHRIHVYACTKEGLEPVKQITGVRGNDNIRTYGGRLLVPGHIKPFRFIRHTGNPERISPVTVFLADPVSGEVQEVYSTDGSAISAGSTAIIYREVLYICQVFEPYLLKIALP